MRRSLAATGTTGLTPVLDARTGTTLHRTRTTTSGLASFVMTHIFALWTLLLHRQAIQRVVSRSCPPSGNTFLGLVERLVTG
jgi:cytosine/uracil/thiamine/allantoin permease